MRLTRTQIRILEVLTNGGGSIACGAGPVHRVVAERMPERVHPDSVRINLLRLRRARLVAVVSCADGYEVLLASRGDLALRNVGLPREDGLAGEPQDARAVAPVESPAKVSQWNPTSDEIATIVEEMRPIIEAFGRRPPGTFVPADCAAARGSGLDAGA